MATGQFSGATMTDTFRIHNGQPLDVRWLQRIDVTFDAVLDGGEYYFVWAAKGTWPLSGPWTPYLANPGFKTTEGANAMQSSNGGTSWYSVQDGLAGQDFPFLLHGKRGVWNRKSG